MAKTQDTNIPALRALWEAAPKGDWDVGRTLDTPQTQRWSTQERESNDVYESLRIFVDFSPLDQGRSRRLVAIFQDPKTARASAIIHNQLPAFMDELERLETRVKHETECAELAIAERDGLNETIYVLREALARIQDAESKLRAHEDECPDGDSCVVLRPPGISPGICITRNSLQGLLSDAIPDKEPTDA